MKDRSVKIVIAVVVLLLGWLVWPTPYAYIDSGRTERINRFTQTREHYLRGEWLSGAKAFEIIQERERIEREERKDDYLSK